MQLSLHYQKFIQLYIFQNDSVIITELNYGPLIIESYSFIGLFAHSVALQIKLKFSLEGYLNPLTCHAIITKPFS